MYEKEINFSKYVFMNLIDQITYRDIILNSDSFGHISTAWLSWITKPELSNSHHVTVYLSHMIYESAVRDKCQLSERHLTSSEDQTSDP